MRGIYAITRWAQFSNIHAWPYSLRHANNIHKSILDQANGNFPSSRFVNVNIAPTLRLYHTFRYPIVTLSNVLKNGSSIPKWSPRSPLGIYLGASPYLPNY